MSFCFRKCHRERGYVLLVLLLIVSLLSISFLALIERVDFQIKRDQEEEFIHRGVEYSRAVRKYVKKFGHYPTSVEALENSNGVRFLRKRYKDPLTGKDFKVLYYGDIKSFNPPPAAVATPSARIPNHLPVPDGQTSNAPQPEDPPNNDAASSAVDDSSPASDAQQIVSKESDQSPANQDGVVTSRPSAESSSDAASEDTGGRAIVGVTSYSKRETIRVFNRKNHYDQWEFIYDPSTDVGIMKAPQQPLLRGAGQVQNVQNEQSTTSNAPTNAEQK